jgi:hypothetical protein
MIKKKNLDLFIIILLPFISWFFINKIFGDSNKNFNEFALGTDNKMIINELLEQKILCSSLEDIENCIEFLKKKNFKKKILWLGNSQLNAVNQPEINSKIAPYIVSEYFYNKDIGLITFASPNMNLQEYLSVVNYFLAQLDFNIILLSLVFDDFREDGIRKELLINLEEKINLEKKINLEEKINLEKKINLEERIIFFLDKEINWTQVRSQAQGSISIFLYKLRNDIFGITPSTVRKKIKPIYEKNFFALSKILERAESNHIKTVMYIAPIRNDVDLPYDFKEYLDFKNTLAIKAKQFSSNLYNLEDIVPNKFWGEKIGTRHGIITEIDFMHFQNNGHKILAKKIINILDDIIK